VTFPDAGWVSAGRDVVGGDCGGLFYRKRGMAVKSVIMIFILEKNPDIFMYNITL
jgi:hypothetical protein